MNSEDYEGGFDASNIEAMLASISSDFRGWAKGFVPLAVGSADPSAVERVARSFFAMDPRVAYGLARMIFLGDQREVLDDVTVPCTLVHVSRDFVAPPSVGRYMHFPQLVKPEELLGILNVVLGEEGLAAGDVAVGQMNGEVGLADAEVNGDIGLAPQSKLLV
jgi:hypothetical protein